MNSFPKKKLSRDRLKELNKTLFVQGLKFCNGCFNVKIHEDFGRNLEKSSGLRDKCKPCRNAQRVANRKANRQKFLAYEHTERYKKQQFIYTLKRNYGITLDDFNLMLTTQNNKCRICNQEERHKNKKILSVDHCHESGKVRGLLCHRCNVILGLIKENTNVLENAISYLKENKK